MSQVQITDSVPPPVRSGRVERMTEPLRALKPGQSARPLDQETFWAFKAYAAYHGWRVTTEKISGTETYAVWRLEDAPKNGTDSVQPTSAVEG